MALNLIEIKSIEPSFLSLFKPPYHLQCDFRERFFAYGYQDFNPKRFQYQGFQWYQDRTVGTFCLVISSDSDDLNLTFPWTQKRPFCLDLYSRVHVEVRL